ncbi:MAG: hypothetical protein PHX51_06625 [Clostridia bacterium]|nr:hypothetical protein [Clostridia bacterium]
MEIIKKLLRSKRGDWGIYSIAIVFVSFILFAVIAEVFRVNIILTKVRENVEIAVTTAIIDNSATAFGGVREGAANLYERAGGAYVESVDDTDVYDKLEETFLVSYEGGAIVSYTAAGNLNYRISNVVVSPLNPDYDAAPGEGVQFRTTYTVSVLLFGIDETTLPLNIPQETISTYKPIF